MPMRNWRCVTALGNAPMAVIAAEAAASNTTVFEPCVTVTVPALTMEGVVQLASKSRNDQRFCRRTSLYALLTQV